MGKFKVVDDVEQKEHASFDSLEECQVWISAQAQADLYYVVNKVGDWLTEPKVWDAAGVTKEERFKVKEQRGCANLHEPTLSIPLTAHQYAQLMGLVNDAVKDSRIYEERAYWQPLQEHLERWREKARALGEKPCKIFGKGYPAPGKTFDFKYVTAEGFYSPKFEVTTVVFNWGARGTGFGQLTMKLKKLPPPTDETCEDYIPEQVWFDTECMSPQFAGEMFEYLVKKSAKDHDPKPWDKPVGEESL